VFCYQKLSFLNTQSRYFHKTLLAVSSGPFYNHFVQLPDVTTSVPNYIRKNSKFYPFFEHALGALDGTHINASTSAVNRHANRDRKGGITQNCLAVCSFDFRFLYFISGFEGSAADATMFMHARLMDFMIPHGKYYLGDAGFALCDTLLAPYRGIRYHLAEWGRAGVRQVAYYFISDPQFNMSCDRPANKEELFNLRHAQARNIIERIFGVLKKRWDILNRAPQYGMDTQARIPAGLAAVHNFIMDNDDTDIYHYLSQLEPNEPQNTYFGEPGNGSIPRIERERAEGLRDEIATRMWESYQQFLLDHPEVLEQEFNVENE
jgi:hypothetical protein